MEYIPLSFIAGVLTVLAPCILPVLPIVIGGSVDDAKNRFRPVIIVTSLGISIFLFTLLLKVTTVLIGVDPTVWKLLSGGIIIFFGVITIFPKAWESVSLKLGLSTKSNQLLQNSGNKTGLAGSILVGMSLGPVFASCSPTYFLIIGVILPQNVFAGFANLLVYVFGFAIVLFAVALLGQKFISKARWAADPHGWFKKVLGVLFIVTGVLIITGLDKKFTEAVLDAGTFDVTKIEMQLLDRFRE